MFKGIYHGKSSHAPDLDSVLHRAYKHGIDHILITASKPQETFEAISIISHYSNINNSFTLSSCSSHLPIKMGTTIGIHPCQSKDHLVNQTVAEEIVKLISNPHVKAFGELGLDYDRFDYANKEEQLLSFSSQLEIWKHHHPSQIKTNASLSPMVAKAERLPLFLHMRNAFSDFHDIISKYFDKEKNDRGVVHSFTGTLEEANSLINLGFYIGINGCSLREECNLKVVKELPLERLMIESDAPWCQIRPTHASWPLLQSYRKSINDSNNELLSIEQEQEVKKEKHQMNKMVKGRNEPCNTSQVLQILSIIKETPIDHVAEILYKNSIEMFFQE